MSEAPRLVDEMARFGPVAFLVTANDDGSPHLTSVAVDLVGDATLRCRAGNRTTANAAARSRVSILWSDPGGGDYALIADGAASIDASGAVAVAVDRAVLHRLATADDSLPSCVTLRAG